MRARLLAGGVREVRPQGYTRPMGSLADVLALLEPHALLLAFLLPPVIRVVGHFIPEELFMLGIGVLAARAGSAGQAAALLAAAGASHLATDQLLYGAGRWLRPRLDRFPRLGRRLERVTRRLTASPAALLGLIPARVLPLGRGAWLAGCGVVAIPWGLFLLADLAALVVHVVVWCGLGWWMASDIARLELSAEMAKTAGWWLAAALVLATSAVLLRRSTGLWPAAVWVLRGAGRTLRQHFTR